MPVRIGPQVQALPRADRLSAVEQVDRTELRLAYREDEEKVAVARIEQARLAPEAAAEAKAMARALVTGRSSLRSVGAGAGLSENAVGPRLARTPMLAAYANDNGRVTASGVERARYDHETGRRPEPGIDSTDSTNSTEQAPRQPMRFRPRRTP